MSYIVHNLKQFWTLEELQLNTLLMDTRWKTVLDHVTVSNTAALFSQCRCLCCYLLCVCWVQTALWWVSARPPSEQRPWTSSHSTAPPAVPTAPTQTHKQQWAAPKNVFSTIKLLKKLLSLLLLFHCSFLKTVMSTFKNHESKTRMIQIYVIKKATFCLVREWGQLLRDRQRWKLIFCWFSLRFTGPCWDWNKQDGIQHVEPAHSFSVCLTAGLWSFIFIWFCFMFVNLFLHFLAACCIPIPAGL